MNDDRQDDARDSWSCHGFQALAREEGLDQAIFEEVFDCFAERIRQFSLSYCTDKARAEDTFQDTFLKVFENLSSYRGDAPIEAWIRRISISACERYRRGRKNDPRRHVDADALPLAEQDPLTQEARVQLQQQLERVARTLEDVPEVNRDLLLAQELDGLTIQELAERFSLSADAVKSRLKRTRAVLRKKLVEA